MSAEATFLPSPEHLKTRHSSKWRRYPSDVLPMHVAEMDYEIAPEIKATLTRMIAESDIGYLGPVPEVAASFAGFTKRHWGWEPDQEQVRIATDVGVGTVEILRTLGKPGDRVLLNSPVYHSFYTWIEEAGMELVDAPLQQSESEWIVDLAEIETQFRAGAKFYLLCSPQNPMGKIFTKAELETIAELAALHGVTVISDEIHAPLVYDETQYTPWLNVSSAAREVGVVVTAASKSFNLAGLKASIVVTQSATMQKRLANLQPAIHWRSGILGAFGMATAYQDCDAWLRTAVAHNQQSRDYLLEQLATRLPQVKTWQPNSGYLAWLDVSALKLGTHPAEQIIREQRVAFVGGWEHGAAYVPFLRINFACNRSSIDAAIAALEAYV